MNTVRVFLHGYFRDFHDSPIEVQARTVHQAVEMVTRQLPGFRPNAVRGRHRARAVGCDTLESLHQPPTNGEVHLVPQFSGGKKGGFLQIIVGAVLMAAGFFFQMPLLVKIGAMMVLGGIAAMLAPTPEVDKDNNDERKSRYLGTPKNTVEIGTRIPILYGEHKVFGHYLSFDIDAQTSNGS